MKKAIDPKNHDTKKRPFRRLGESHLITCGSILIPHSFEKEDPILAPRAIGSVAPKVNQSYWMGYVFFYPPRQCRSCSINKQSHENNVLRGLFIYATAGTNILGVKKT